MKKIFIPILAIALAAACVPDERNQFLPADSFGITARNRVEEASVHAGAYTLGIAKNGKGQQSGTVRMSTDPDAYLPLLEAYNKEYGTAYKAVPASLVSTETPEFTFAKDEVVKNLTVTWDPFTMASLIGDQENYAIPILIESGDLGTSKGREFMLIRMVRSGVSILQKSIVRVVNENKVKPDAGGNQPQLKETLILDVEMDNAIKNVGVNFPVKVDNTLIDKYNQTQETPGTEAPDGLLTLTGTTAGIPESGKSCTVKMTLDLEVLLEGGELPPFPDYVIPVVLDVKDASATLSGQPFELKGLSYGNLVTYVVVKYEPVEQGLSVSREWGKYSTAGAFWSDYIDGFTAGAERNVTLDDEYIYIAETNQSKNLWAISLTDPSTYKKLPVGTVLEEGTFYVSCPRVIKNTDSALNEGKDLLVVSNMHTGGDPKLYVYDKGISEDPSVINMTTWASRRLGDTFTWWGTWQEGMLLFKDFNSAQGTVTFKTTGGVPGTMYLKGRIAAPPVTGAGGYFPFPDDIRKGVSATRGGTQAWLTSTDKDLLNLDGADNAPTLVELSGYFVDTAFRFFPLGDKRYVAYIRQVDASDGRLFILEGEATQAWEDIILERNVIYQAAIQNESENDGLDETPCPKASTHSGMDLDVRVKGTTEAYIAVVKQNVGLSLFKLTYNM